MKIRIMGTREECEQARLYYSQFLNNKAVSSCSVSRLYSNRNSTNQYRIYIEVSCEFDLFNVTTTDYVKLLAKLGGRSL